MKIVKNVLFILFFYIFLNFGNNSYCNINNLKYIIKNDSLKDTIEGYFKIKSIKKIEGHSFFRCNDCKFKYVNHKYELTNDSSIFKLNPRRKEYVREAYLIEAYMLDNKICSLYQIISLQENINKQNFEKIKKGKIYYLKLIKFFKRDTLPSIRNDRFNISGLEFDIINIGCNVCVPLNLKGLYYYELE